MKPVPSILSAPWCIDPHWLRVVYGVWSRGSVDAPALAQAKADWQARKVTRPRLDEPGAAVEGTGGTLRVVGSVGVIAIEGPLFRHADMFTDISGGTSYDAVWKGLEAALAHPMVKSILLRVNSPGGEADGVSELGKGIAAAGKHKPVWAFADGMCASAAYWLASQAQHIVAEETAEIGSIGVRCGIVDDSARDAAAGIREIEIISSLSPGKRSTPVDDEVIGRLQTRIDDLASLFVAAVARGRGVTPETVMADYGQGDVMIASKALAAGLVDEIGNFNGVLEAMSSTPNPIGSSASTAKATRRKGATMSTQSKPVAEMPELKCAGCEDKMDLAAPVYCAKCALDDEDDEGDKDDKDGHEEPDGDEDEDMKAAVAFRADVLATLGAATPAAAHGRIAALVDIEKASTALHQQVIAAETESRRHALRSVLERGLSASTLSLGAIQRGMVVALRGDAKRQWVAAMDGLAAKADASGATIGAAGVIEAACSVSLTADDLEALREYAANASPVAAATHAEPARDAMAEATEMDAIAAKVAQYAAKARATLDRRVPTAAK
jgi:ClpP class serine protease